MAEIEGMGDTNTVNPVENAENVGTGVKNNEGQAETNTGSQQVAQESPKGETGTVAVQNAINDSGFNAADFGKTPKEIADAQPGKTFTAGNDEKNATITVNTKPGSFNLQTNQED